MKTRSPLRKKEAVDTVVNKLLLKAEREVSELHTCFTTSIRKDSSASAQFASDLHALQQSLEEVKHLYIYRLYLYGMLQKDIAVRFSLSKARISQIIKQMKEELSGG